MRCRPTISYGLLLMAAGPCIWPLPSPAAPDPEPQAQSTLPSADKAGAPPTTLAEALAELQAPARHVGRLATLSGETQILLPGDAEWQTATPNLPLLAGTELATGPNGRSLLQFGRTRIALDSNSRLSVTKLDDSSIDLALSAGTTVLDLPRGSNPALVQLVTPRGTINAGNASRVTIQTDAGNATTIVTAVAGTALLRGANLSDTLRAGESATITDERPPIVIIGPAASPPPLLAWALPPPTPRPTVSLPATLQALPGITELATSGTWQASPQYGPVWQPRVPTGWAPSQTGRWTFINPIGWTWIDDSPSGWATSHYGRWLDDNGAWTWIPDPAYLGGAFYPPPVFAPANVRFFTQRGILNHPPILTWAPLKPGEPSPPAGAARPSPPRAPNAPIALTVARSSIPTVTGTTLTTTFVGINGTSVAVPPNLSASLGLTAQPTATSSPNRFAAGPLLQPPPRYVPVPTVLQPSASTPPPAVPTLPGAVPSLASTTSLQTGFRATSATPLSAPTPQLRYAPTTTRAWIPPPAGYASPAAPPPTLYAPSLRATAALHGGPSGDPFPATTTAPRPLPHNPTPARASATYSPSLSATAQLHAGTPSGYAQTPPAAPGSIQRPGSPTSGTARPSMPAAPRSFAAAPRR